MTFTITRQPHQLRLFDSNSEQHLSIFFSCQVRSFSKLSWTCYPPRRAQALMAATLQATVWLLPCSSGTNIHTAFHTTPTLYLLLLYPMAIHCECHLSRRQASDLLTRSCYSLSCVHWNSMECATFSLVDLTTCTTKKLYSIFIRQAFRPV